MAAVKNPYLAFALMAVTDGPLELSMWNF